MLLADALRHDPAPLRIEPVPDRITLAVSTPSDPIEVWVWRHPLIPGRTRWLVRIAGCYPPLMTTRLAALA